MPLNGRLAFILDGHLDPLSVTPAAVTLWTVAGEPIACERRVEAGRLVVEVVVDEALLRAAPLDAMASLAGIPSPHALRTVDGRALGATARVELRFEPRLAAGAGAPRLVAVNGARLPLVSVPAGAGAVTLDFDGALDPSTIRPEACPLVPLAGGLPMATPLLPALSWSCAGDRFTLRLVLPGRPGPLRLDLRRFSVRGPSGARPEPALVIDLPGS